MYVKVFKQIKLLKQEATNTLQLGGEQVRFLVNGSKVRWVVGTSSVNMVKTTELSTLKVNFMVCKLYLSLL